MTLRSRGFWQDPIPAITALPTLVDLPRVQHNQTFCPGNGTTGRADTSTRGGFPGACMGEHDGQQNTSKDVEVGVPLGVGQSRAQTGSWGSTRSGGEGPGVPTSVTNDEWEAPRWEQIIPHRSPTDCPHSLQRTGTVELDCRINLGINNVRADGVINTRVRQPYRPTSNTFGGARRHTGLSWFRPFRRSVPQPYPRGWTRIQTRLTRSGLRRRQRRYKAVCPVFFLPLKPHTYIWLKTVLNVVDITSKRRRRV